MGRLERRLPLLTGGHRDAPERQRTLRAAIEWSYELLSDQDRQLFTRLAVFAGGFDLEAAEGACAAELDRLESLLEQSLLRTTDEGRFFYFETVRELGLEKLEETGEAGQIRRRHAEYFLGIARSANLTNEAEGEQHHDLVIRYQGNVRAALEWLLASGEIELGLRLAAMLENFWVTSNPVEGQRWLGELLARAGDLPDELRAFALRAYGASLYIFGEFEEGARWRPFRS